LIMNLIEFSREEDPCLPHHKLSFLVENFRLRVCAHALNKDSWESFRSSSRLRSQRASSAQTTLEKREVKGKGLDDGKDGNFANYSIATVKRRGDIYPHHHHHHQRSLICADLVRRPVILLFDKIVNQK
jgi:hypothetical protein